MGRDYLVKLSRSEAVDIYQNYADSQNTGFGAALLGYGYTQFTVGNTGGVYENFFNGGLYGIYLSGPQNMDYFFNNRIEDMNTTGSGIYVLKGACLLARGAISVRETTASGAYYGIRSNGGKFDMANNISRGECNITGFVTNVGYAYNWGGIGASHKISHDGPAFNCDTTTFGIITNGNFF